MEVRVTIYPEKVRQLVEAMELSAEQAVEAVKSDIVSSQVVPKNTGELERSGFVQKSKSKYRIIYDTPYARRLYWHPEYNFRTDKNPNAQGMWMHTYLDGEKKEFFKRVFVARLKANSKGLIK